MAITAEQEKQKVAFPEIVDDLQDTAYAESGQTAAQMPAEEAVSEAAVQKPVQNAVSEAAVQKPAQNAASGAAEAEDNDVSIDVDIENMEWEVESAGMADAPADYGYDHDDYSDEYDDYSEPQHDYRGRYNDRNTIRYSRRMNKHLFTWLFSFLLGMYGADRFARGQVGLGILKMLSFGGFGFWYFADLLIAIHKSFVSENSEYDDLFFDEYGRYVL